jgi:hypothetical protein
VIAVGIVLAVFHGCLSVAAGTTLGAALNVTAAVLWAFIAGLRLASRVRAS